MEENIPQPIPQDPQEMPNPEMDGAEHHDHKKAIVVVIVLVVLLGLALWLGQFVGDSKIIEIGEGQFLMRVDTGEVVESFPKEFLIDEVVNGEVAVQDSYQIEYRNQGTVLSVISYNSGISLVDNIAAFDLVLSDGVWSVSEYPDKSIGSGETTFFDAFRGSERVNISLAFGEDGIEVVVAYLK